jgi:uncharacterized protein
MTVTRNHKSMAESSTILRCLVGSQAYGLSTDSSDRDERGVCLEPLWAALPLNGAFEQYEYRDAEARTGRNDARSEAGDLDLTIYSLRKFLRLATYGNPNVVELLFITGPCRLDNHPLGTELQALYPYIVSRDAGRRYLGYMEAQKQRLLGERGQMRVTRTDLIERNGYDTKFAMHLLRLGFQGVELQEQGSLTLPIAEPTAGFLRAVKAGSVELHDVLQRTGELELRLKDLISNGPIQGHPDFDVVEDWMQTTYMARWLDNDA